MTETEDGSKNWFQTLPGILTSVAALITALGSIYGAIIAWFPKDDGSHVVAKAEQCIPGYVWRQATPEDRVCVTMPTHEKTLEDNMQAGSRRDPRGGPHGADTCLTGFVWREVFIGDHICVLPETHTQVLEDDREGPNRIAR
jgi:hypothetical protein